jgi:hypothetical protein
VQESYIDGCTGSLPDAKHLRMDGSNLASCLCIRPQGTSPLTPPPITHRHVESATCPPGRVRVLLSRVSASGWWMPPPPGPLISQAAKHPVLGLLCWPYLACRLSCAAADGKGNPIAAPSLVHVSPST